MLFLIGIAFAMTFVFNRLAITNGVPLIPYVLWQALGGALILLIACGVRGEFPRVSPRYLRVYFITSMFNVCLPIFVLSLVAPKLPSGILSLGLMLIPLIIYALALALGMNRFRWVRLIGILLGLAGVLLVLLPKASLPSSDGSSLDWSRRSVTHWERSSWRNWILPNQNPYPWPVVCCQLRQLLCLW